MTLTDAIELTQSRYNGLADVSTAVVLLVVGFSVFCVIGERFSHEKTGLIGSLFSRRATAKLRVIAWGAISVLLVAGVVVVNQGSIALSEHRASKAAYAKVEPFLHEHYGLTFNQEYGPAVFLNGQPTEAKLDGKNALVQVVDLDGKPGIVLYHGESIQAK